MGRFRLGAGVGILCLMLTSRFRLPAQSTDLSVPNVRATLAQQHAKVAANPKDPAAHVQLAYTLCDAGMNDLAIEEVRKATTVAPKSAFAFSAQAWILRHNAVGVDFGKGFDYDAAVASYRRAIELDPTDLDIRESLANLYDHDRNGVEYGGGANLAGAIELYRYAVEHRRPAQPQVTENLSLALFYSGLYGEALAAIKGHAPTEKMDGIAVGATAALMGSKAAIQLATTMSDPEERRRNALQNGAEGLWDMRLYPQAADLLSAILPNPDGQGVTAKIQLFRQLKPYHTDDLAGDDPRRPVAVLLRGILLGLLTTEVQTECAKGKLLADGEDCGAVLAGMDQVGAEMRVLTRRTGLPAAVLDDIMLGNLKLGTTAAADTGALVNVTFVGQTVMSFFCAEAGGKLPRGGCRQRSESDGKRGTLPAAP